MRRPFFILVIMKSVSTILLILLLALNSFAATPIVTHESRIVQSIPTNIENYVHDTKYDGDYSDHSPFLRFMGYLYSVAGILGGIMVIGVDVGLNSGSATGIGVGAGLIALGTTGIVLLSW